MLRMFAVVAVLAGTVHAMPSPDRRAKAGANHHIGDASFRERFGRAPRDGRDDERTRMTTHLAFVRDWLASRPATEPALAGRRAEILGYLSDYIAKGTTPDNAHLPWRTPVFIDDRGTICAVGYLIEQTAGRALPERIAAQYRYEFIDDIAAEEPAVAAWVAQSGVTLEELATIQPAYREPDVDTWRTWNLAKYPPPDGEYRKNGAAGAFFHRRMEGTWVVSDEESGAVRGVGELARGDGAWTSYYPSGKVLATGNYRDNRADGPWQLYFESGHLAAEGAFRRGDRHGAWTFYYDAPGKTPIAKGRFGARGAVTGTWEHFGADGALVAISKTITPDQFIDSGIDIDGGEGFLLTVVPKAGEMQHAVHQGTFGGVHARLDELAKDGERLYAQAAFAHDALFDQDGHLLARDGDGWTARDCHWSALRKAIAHDGDVARLHGVLYQDAARRSHGTGVDLVAGRSGTEPTDDPGPRCGAARSVSAARGKVLDELLAARDATVDLSTDAVRDAVLRPEGPADLPRALAASMAMYIEWPHIDGLFVQLFETMAGRVSWPWYDGDPERPEAQ